MGTRWSVSVDCDATLDLEALRQDLAAAVQQVDAQMSPWKPDSDLVRLNRAPVDAWVDLPPEMLEVLACAMDIHRQSAGAFDPCVGALVDAWGFGAARDAPDAAAINSVRQAAPCTMRQGLELDCPAGRARKHAAVQLDLCGIAKGYAVDRMAPCCSSTACSMRLRRSMGNCAPWATRPAVRPGPWRSKRPMQGAVRCAG
jgi:thiamine biosynthesis lipoprotein